MSKPLTFVIPHSLGQVEARKRLENGLTSLTADLPGGVQDLKQAWEGDTLAFSAGVMGKTISGTMDVAPDEVRLEVALPGLMGMFAGKIRGKIEDRGRLLLT